VPWLVALALCGLYLITMARGITFLGAPTLSRLAGWGWEANYFNPLHILLTYPVRWLPEAWQIVALNVVSVVCAALTLALLARSVSLLPQDQTRAQRMLEPHEHGLLSIHSAWLPPVVSALVCGLQLTFWEHATIATGEAVDLLVFAYTIRCLLEFRITRKDSWLTRMAFLYGLGMTSNFALIGFLPLLVVAVAWIRGLREFFRIRFFLKMGLCALAGLLLYLVPPMLETASGTGELGFWQILRSNLGFQKNALLGYPRYILVLVGLTSLLPVVYMGLKVRALGDIGEVSSPSMSITSLMNHLIHALFLAACLYVLFDQQFSPRNLGRAGGYPLLTLHYLGALSVGYFVGYFLLLFGRSGRRRARPTFIWLWFGRICKGLVWAASVAVPVALLVKNWPLISISTGTYLSQFGALVGQQLRASAPEGAIALCDDSYKFLAVRAALAQEGQAEKYVLVDTTSLLRSAYQRHLGERHPDRWPQLSTNLAAMRLFPSDVLVDMLRQIAKSNAIFYLHPSFGYYFEIFEQRPRGLIYELRPLGTNQLGGAVLTEAELSENAAFWRQMKEGELRSIIRDVKRFGSDDDGPGALAFMSYFYSRLLNQLGVEFQRAGKLDQAAEYYQTALDCNPQNPMAFLNLDYNQNLRRGKREPTAPSDGAIRRLRGYGGNWNALLSFNGPVDEPNTCFLLGRTFALGGNLRQAAQQLARTVEYVPDDLASRLALVGTLNQIGFYDLALQHVSEVRARLAPRTLEVSDALALLGAEAWAFAGKGDTERARQILETAQRDHPARNEPFATLSEIYVALGQTSNAVQVLEKQVQTQPNNATGLISLGRLRMLNNDFKGAIPLLDQAVRLDRTNALAVLNRAIAYLQTGRLDEAKRDYEQVRALMTRLPYTVLYGLQEIAWRQKDMKLALEYCADYLRAAPPGTPEYRFIEDRHKALKSGGL
jgi:tetratricopeptide (TPR) repeat protein